MNLKTQTLLEVVAGQGEWVCEALGTTSFPSCSTTENCSVPKSSSSTYEGCGYLSTGQRLVTTNIYQSWCETTQDTVVGECIGADDPNCAVENIVVQEVVKKNTQILCLRIWNRS
jgi:hypothetical protein